MSITDFISSFTPGTANKFRVQITWPGVAGTPNIRDELVVNAAGLPASVVGTIPVAYQGRQIPYPGDRTFEEWTITVMNDRSFSHRNAFENWSNAINAHDANVQSTESFRDVLGTIDIVSLDKSQNIVKTYKMHNAWPTNVAQLDLGYDQNDVVPTYTVTFAYSHWQSATSAST